jgi:site-specific DNA recombinase
MADLLGAVRLSDVTDETTSPERQEADILDYATFKRHNVIHIVEDVDVSGVVNPFEREGLGPWLREPLLDQWQILAVAKLDRLTRSLLDFEELWKFLKAQRKTLVSIAEDLNFSTPSGRLMARQLVMFAEYEREMIRGRVKNAYETIRQHGQYAGGQFPFGYIPEKLEPKGWRLVPHPVYAATVSEIADRLIRGESLGSICRWLEAEGIPTPRNAVREYSGKPLLAAHWAPSSLTKILRSPAVVGEVTTTGGPLRDADRQLLKRSEPTPVRDRKGQAIKRAAPLIDRQAWQQVKTILDRNAKGAAPRVNASPLLRIAYCLECGGPLYVNQAISAGKTYRYYLCRKANHQRGCTARRVDAARLERFVETKLLDGMRDLPYTVTVPLAPTDRSTQMAELAEAIGHLASQGALTRATGGDASELEARQAANERSLAELAKMQADQPTGLGAVMTKQTGESWGHRWDRQSPSERNAMMRDDDVRIDTARREDRKVRMVLHAHGKLLADTGWKP